MNTLLSCPLHGFTAQTAYSSRSGYTLKRCTRCGLVHLASVPEGADLEFYTDVAIEKSTNNNKDAIEYWTLPDYYKKHYATFITFFAQRMQRILAAAPHTKSLLDIGCGYGFFLQYAQGYVESVTGVELDPAVAAIAQASGLPVLHRSAESLLGEDTYDCIVLCDVLEHLRDPLIILKLCHSLLNPHGVLYVQVPNLLGFKLPWGHSWGLPHHIWQFNTRSLKAMLEASDFTAVQHTTGILGIVGVLENGGPTLLKKMEWLGANWLNCGNRLQVTAIRR